MAEQRVARAWRPSPVSLPPAWRPAFGWVLGVVAAAAVVAATAWAGLWFVPFVAGVAGGAASLRWRRMVLLAVAGSVAGYVLPLWIMALRGLPVGATGRAIAGLAGLPPHAAVTVVATLLLAAIQALVGAWLARALLPRAWRRRAMPEAR